MSLKEVLSVFGPGLKNPTLDDIDRLMDDLLESSLSSCSATMQNEARQVSFGSRRFVVLAGAGSQRECTGSNIQGCLTLPQVVLQPSSHSRGNSKFRLFTNDDYPVLALVTTVDLNGRASTIIWIKPDEKTDDCLSVSRQQTTVVVTALTRPTSKLLERLENAREILIHAVQSNASNFPPPSPSVPGSLALVRRRRHQKPFIPRQRRYDGAGRRTSSVCWSLKPSCFVVACAIPVLLVLWRSVPTEFTNDENRTSAAAELSELELQRRKILTLRTYDFSPHVSYSTRWPPTTNDIEKLSEKTLEFLTYAYSMRALRVRFESRGDCSSRHWLGEDLRANYFAMHDIITLHAAWIMENGDVPEIYRFFVGSAYKVMDLMDHMESRTLCYVGDDLARDSFEFYVRMLFHFEYAAHVIVLRQWGIQQAFDTVDVLMRQANSIRSWLEERWIQSEDSTCLKYAFLQTPVDPSNLLSQLPLENSVVLPYAEDFRKYVMTSPPWR